jgi:signal transduction histidine kinase
MEDQLGKLAPWNPERIAAVRNEVAQYEEFAAKAVDEYTSDRRVIGNSLLAQARQHSILADRLLGSIVTDLTGEAISAREVVVAEAAAASRLSQIVVAAAVLVGAFLTLLVLRSIVVPLRRLVAAMDGLNAANVDVPIPVAGPDEIGAVARTLSRFRDTLKELREALARFEALRAVGQAVGSTLDLEAMLALVVSRAVELSGAHAGMIYGYDQDSRRFRFRASHGAEEALAELLDAEPVRIGDGAVGGAAVIGSVMHVRDLLDTSELAAPGIWDTLARFGYRSLLTAPLMHEGRILGALVVARREAGDFSKDVVELIEALATQSALAVRNAKLFEEQGRRERELRAAHEELKAAQASLIHAEKMASLGQLTAGIAHEIKNPLNFVNNFSSLSVELLDELKQTARPAIAILGADRRAEVEEVVELLTANLKKIAEHGKRADGIVKSMLAHSRSGGGERQSTDLNALLEEALNLAYHGARSQNRDFNITLERELDRTIAPIEVVPQDISRVLLNLFGNSFYAAEKRRRETTDMAFRPMLKVVTRDLGDEVEIRVRDNGTGIAPELRDKLFQPFFTTKPTGEGTGLGLSISNEIVTQEHGGTIEVDSVAGEFTEFTIRLPRARQPAPVEAGE